MAWSEFHGRWYNGRISPFTDEKQNAGRVLFVSSVTGTDAAGYGGSPETPYATIGQAFITCVSGEGWKIILMPGHAEAYNAAAGWDVTKDGIEILGIGNGDLIPTFTFEGAGIVPTIDLDFGGADMTVKHVKFVNSEDGCTAPMDINAANITFDDCIFEDEGTDNTIDWFTLDAAADELLIINCRHWGTDTAGSDSFLTLTAAPDHLRIINLHSHGQFAVGNIDLSIVAATDVLVSKCCLENSKATPVANIVCHVGMTGEISDNYMAYVDDATATWITTIGAYGCHQNFGVNNTAETGMFVIAGGVSA